MRLRTKTPTCNNNTAAATDAVYSLAPLSVCGDLAALQAKVKPPVDGPTREQVKQVRNVILKYKLGGEEHAEV